MWHVDGGSFDSLFAAKYVNQRTLKSSNGFAPPSGFKSNGKSLVVDVSPDFRQQALKAKIPRIDAVLFTHPHADHIGGIDEIRSYNFIQKERIQAFGHEWTVRDLPQRYPYIFKKMKIEGGGVSQIDLHEFSLEAPNFPCKA